MLNYLKCKYSGAACALGIKQGALAAWPASCARGTAPWARDWALINRLLIAICYTLNAHIAAQVAGYGGV